MFRSSCLLTRHKTQSGLVLTCRTMAIRAPMVSSPPSPIIHYTHDRKSIQPVQNRGVQRGFSAVAVADDKTMEKPEDVEVEQIVEPERLAGSWKGYKPGQLDDKLAKKAAAQLLSDPANAAKMLGQLQPEQRRIVALSWALTELEEEFAKADRNRDGVVSYVEFKEWVDGVIEAGKTRDSETPVEKKQLWAVAITTCIPFICFGAVDNGLMVIYGDVIDAHLGVLLGFSTLASAALGNAISNIFGMLSHGTIHRWSDKLGLPDARLTLAQRKMKVVHTYSTAGSTVGVFVGCLLGMLPLAFMDQKAKEAERANAKH